MKRFLLLLTVFLLQVHYGDSCQCIFESITSANMQALVGSMDFYSNISQYQLTTPNYELAGENCSLSVLCPIGSDLWISDNGTSLYAKDYEIYAACTGSTWTVSGGDPDYYDYYADNSYGTLYAACVDYSTMLTTTTAVTTTTETTTTPTTTTTIGPCTCNYQLLDNSNLDLISSQPQYSTVSGKVVTQPTASLGSDNCSVSLSCPDGEFLLAMNMQGGGWYTTDTIEGTCNPSNSTWSFGVSKFCSSLSFSSLTAACVNTCESDTTTTTLAPTTTTTPAPVTCEAGWKLFQRPSGPWCIKIVSGEGSYSQAETSCASMGAVVSSFQNQEEVNYTLTTGLQLMGVASGSLWVGATRRNICLDIGQTTQCTNLTSFAWTDGSATGTDGYVWNPTQPDNAAIPKNQNCIMIFTANVPSLIGVLNGRMDDVPCDPTYSTTTVVRKVRAWPCGKQP